MANQDPSKMELGEYITTKLYSIPYVNSKGYRIGNFLIEINKNDLPFSTYDQVDHFLINLFDYARKASDKDNKNVPPEVFNKNFLKNHKQVIASFKPVKYRKQTAQEAEAAQSTKGGKSNNRRKTNIRRKKKSIKNRTRKVYSRKQK